ncbi:MAG: insulinase family protein [Rhodospirillaceae bacterium]|nr:insulinase family protein [Rhodospirillaceae bacterium]
MAVQVTTLSNGLRVVTDTMTSVETVAVGIWVAAGTRHETADINGISHLLEHMAFKGTARRTAQAIAEEMDNVGGQLNAYTSRDHTAYYAKVLKEDLALAVDILSDILLNSTMDGEELAREQHVVVQEINQADDTPDDIIFDHFQAAAFPDQPMGWPVLGREDIVRSVTPKRLRSYMGANYAADNMVVSASGAVDHDAFVALVERAFATLPRTSAVSEVAGRYAGGDTRQARDLEQMHIVLGFNGVAHSDPDFYNLGALSTLLGEGMSSRLFQEIREKRGLAYSVFSNAQSFSDAGVFSIYIGTGQDDVGKLVPVLRDEIKKAVENVREDEVKRARAQIKAGLLMSLESPGSRCAQSARQIMVYGRPLTTAEIIAKVEGVNAAGITRVARRIFSGPTTLAALGDKKSLDGLSALRAPL